MTQRPHALRLINLALALTCILIALISQIMIRAEARVDCVYTPLEGDPITASWHPNSSVRVEIDDDWNGADRAAFEAGIRKWNDWKTRDCSGVSFDEFVPRHFDDYSALPPAGTVYLMRFDIGDFGGGVISQKGGSPRRVVSATIFLDPGQVNNAPSNTSGPFNYFNYFGTHEIGHTFGLKNCDGCPNMSSIMGGHGSATFNAAGPTRCDVEQVATIYCQIAGEPPDGGSICNPNEASDCYARGGIWDDNYCTCQTSSCDPSGQQEWSCYADGGTWDSYNCICTYGGSGCDPGGWLQQDCEDRGGVWNPANCNCGSTGVCSYMDEQKVGDYTVQFSYCSGNGDLTDCIDNYAIYEACPDASSPHCSCISWEEYTGTDCTISRTAWCP